MAAKRILFFSGTKYARYELPHSTSSVPANWPRDTTPDWPGVFPSSNGKVDAALNATRNRDDITGRIFFFKGSKCAEWSLASGKVTKTWTIKDAWPGVFESGIDAALNYENNRVYFFKGDEYVRYDLGTEKVDVGPVKISKHWKMPFTSGINAAVNPGQGSVFFFKGDQFIRFSVAQDKCVEGPKSITTKWTGLFPNGVDASIEWPHAKVVGQKPDKSGGLGVAVASNPFELLWTPDVMTKVVGSLFVAQASFISENIGAACECAEYRQFIKGTALHDGKKVYWDIPVGGGKVLKRPQTTYLQDFGTDGSQYGYREDPGGGVLPYQEQVKQALQSLLNQLMVKNVPLGLDVYYPQRHDGSVYQVIDIPYLLGPMSVELQLNLQFKGQIIDVCRDDEVMAEKTWTLFAHSS
jgi:hypothetical protein